MSNQQRDTTLGFKVDSHELEALSVLLTEIAQKLGAVDGSWGGPTKPANSAYAGWMHAPGTLPNVSLPNGAPNPAATGGAPVGGPAPGGVAPASAPVFTPGNQMFSGLTTINLSGTVTINISGNVTFSGLSFPAIPGTPHQGAPGQPGTQQSPPQPVNPSPPPQPQPRPQPSPFLNPHGVYNPWGDMRPGDNPVSRIIAGSLLGDPRQFLGSGQSAIEASGQLYIGMAAGDTISRISRPIIEEAKLRQSLRDVTPEQIAALRWRTWTAGAGVVAGGVIGGMIGHNAASVGLGMGIGGTVVGGIGDLIASKIEAQEHLRITQDQFSRAIGITPQMIHDAFQSTTTSGIEPGTTGDFEKTFENLAMPSFGKIAPGLLTNKKSLRKLMAIWRNIPEGLRSETFGNFFPVLESDPLLAPVLQALNDPKQGVDFQSVAMGIAPVLAGMGHLSAAFSSNQMAGGGYLESTRAYLRVQAATGRIGQAQAGVDWANTASSLQQTLGHGRAAGSILEASAPFFAQRSGASIDLVNFWQDQVDHSSGAAREMATRELYKARAQSTQANVALATYRGSAAEARFGETSAIAGARRTSASARLGTLGQTNLFGPAMDSLYGEIEGSIKTKIEGIRDVIAAYRAEGRGDQAIAPLRAEITAAQQELASMMIEKTRRAFADARVIPATEISVAGDVLRGIRGTGGVYGPGMQAAFNQQTSGQQRIVKSLQREYAYYRSNYGDDSPLTQEARRNLERENTNLATIPFQQIDAKYSSIQSTLGALGGAASGQAGMALMTGQGSGAALPFQQQSVRIAQALVTSAVQRLREDMQAGAGPSIIANDNAAFISSQRDLISSQHAMADVQMPARFELGELQERNKLSRLQRSWVEPGNMFSVYRSLYGRSMQRVQAIQERRTQLEQSGQLDDAMRYRLGSQEEEARQKAFDYKTSMQDGWIDRLASWSMNAPSWYGVARPTMGEAAMQLEKGQTNPEFRQARQFGFVSRRGYEFERNKGFFTAGLGNMDLYPGDIGMVAAMGGKQKRDSGANDPGMGQSATDVLDSMYGDTQETGAREDTLQKILQAIMQLVHTVATGTNGFTQPGGGPAGTGGQTVDYFSQARALAPQPGDSRPPR